MIKRVQSDTKKIFDDEIQQVKKCFEHLNIYFKAQKLDDRRNLFQSNPQSFLPPMQYIPAFNSNSVNLEMFEDQFIINYRIKITILCFFLFLGSCYWSTGEMGQYWRRNLG